MTKQHDLKIKRQYYRAVWSGEKRFEIRKNDREFRVGDTVRLREIDVDGDYTGAELTATITYIFNGPGYGVEAGYCVFGIDWWGWGRRV